MSNVNVKSKFIQCTISRTKNAPIINAAYKSMPQKKYLSMTVTTTKKNTTDLVSNALTYFVFCCTTLQQWLINNLCQ